MKKLLAFFASLSLLAFAQLPPNLKPDWDLANAWSRSAEQSQEYCVNGVWLFRGEATLKPEEKITVFYEDPCEQKSLAKWFISNTTGVQFAHSFDTTEKTTGDGSLKVDFKVAPSTNLYHHIYYIDNLPTGRRLEFNIDAKAVYQGPSLNCEIQDSRSWDYLCVHTNSLVNDGKWHTLKASLVLPEGCTRLKILLPRSQAGGVTGTFWLDNLRVISRERIPTAPIPLPQNVAWGQTLVPGNWLSSRTTRWADDDPAKDHAKELRYAWYKRNITIPEHWTRHAVSLRFTRIATNAIIFCNGEPAGQLPFDGGTIDISRWAKPGQTLEIAALVEGETPWEAMPEFVSKPSQSWQQKRQTAGLTGDVFLRATVATPQSLGLGDLQIITTTDNHTITVNAPLRKPAPDGLAWLLTLKNLDGTVAQTFTGAIPAGARTIAASGVWEDVRLWDIAQPNLYTATLAVKNANNELLDESLPERFGFRDFVIKGKNFYLNGLRINFNPCCYWANGDGWSTPAAMKHWLTNAQGAGYNFVYMEDNDKPGQPLATDYLARLCDEMGILCAVTPISIKPGTIAMLHKPETRAIWTKAVTNMVVRLRNHPSLVLWRMNMNMNCYSQDQNPLVLDGRMPFKEGSASQNKEDAMLETNAFVRSVDPTRSTYNHACGKSGEIYTLNNYLGWPELQDLREWLKVWAQNGDKPLFMVEHAIPYPGDFQMRDPTKWWSNEPVMTEYGAILLGERAYELEDPKYVNYIPTIWNKSSRTWSSSYGYFCGNYAPILDECTVITYGVMYPYWRTWGISGAMNAWENGWRRKIKTTPSGVYGLLPSRPAAAIDWSRTQFPGRLDFGWTYDGGPGGEIRTFFDRGTMHELDYFVDTHRAVAFKKLMKRTFAYVAGPTDSWYTVEHAFRSGEKVDKSIILLNDKRTPQTFKVSWQAKIGNAVFATGGDPVEITVQPGEQARLPLSFTVPEVLDKAQAVIVPTVVIDQDDLAPEPFKLQFFPAAAVADSANAAVALVDPAGRTAKALAAIGLKPQLISAEAPLPAGITHLFVGCNALDTIAQAPVFDQLTERVRQGLNVVFFEQSEDALKKVFALRVFTPGIRTAWVRNPQHPFLKGFTDDDFSNWRGATTLGPLEGLPKSLDLPRRWERVWRCSQEGVLASTVFEKPHKLAMLPLLDTGFDLRYTPLCTAACGRGTICFCQLDVTDRLGHDPVADQLITNLWQQLGQPPAPATHPIMHAGSSPLFAALPPVDFTNAAEAVIVLSRGCGDWLKANSATLMKQTAATVFAVGLTADELALLATVNGQKRFTVGTAVNWLNFTKATAFPEPFQGLSIGDFRWRKKLSTAVITSIASAQPAAWLAPNGICAVLPAHDAPRLVWFAALPEFFDAQERADLVFTNVKTERLIRTVLANLRAADTTYFTDCLGPHAVAPDEAKIYSDKRVPRDDPYANMRW